MRHVMLIILGALAGPVYADSATWLPMTGAEIAAGLSERTLEYETATQTFYASGKTLYDSGRPSWGYWRVQGDQYCSQWPPNDLWACYDMQRHENRLRFVGSGDDITEGVYGAAE